MVPNNRTGHLFFNNDFHNSITQLIQEGMITNLQGPFEILMYIQIRVVCIYWHVCQSFRNLEAQYAYSGRYNFLGL